MEPTSHMSVQRKILTAAGIALLVWFTRKVIGFGFSSAYFNGFWELQDFLVIFLLCYLGVLFFDRKHTAASAQDPSIPTMAPASTELPTDVTVAAFALSAMIIFVTCWPGLWVLVVLIGSLSTTPIGEIIVSLGYALGFILLGALSTWYIFRTAKSTRRLGPVIFSGICAAAVVAMAMWFIVASTFH